ncbi:MAG: hypothetical protein ACOYXC_00290 [Candidatus Rifleibacteriota bacterium]
MKKASSLIATCLLALSLLTAPSAQAATQTWIDATHMFDQDVEKLVKNVKLETRKERAKKVRAPEPVAKKYQVGDVETFFTKNIVENKFEETRAVLKAIGKNCYVFLEEGKAIPQDAIDKVQKSFDENIYPTNTGNFGFEWKPGIDGDERITLLMFDIKDGFNGQGGFVGGYFFAGDEFLNSQIPANYNIKSNEREMFYLDIYPSDPTKDHYMSVVAHEFQHMIHFAHDSREATWVNEACSQIAPFLCGFGHASQILSYMKTPDNSLVAWSEPQMLANYGQVYLWNYYIYNRFLKGNSSRVDFFKKLVDSQAKGLAGYVEALKPLNVSVTDTFEKFMVANFVNDPRLGKAGEYSYDKTLGRLLLPVSQTISALPGQVEGEVFFWSADAVKVELANARSQIEITLTAPMFQLGYDQYNGFSVAVIQSNSRGQVAPKISWMSVDQVKERKTQGGTVKISPDKDFDTATVIVMGIAPEEVDETVYKKSKGIKYSLSIKDSGAAVARASASVDSSEILNEYVSLAADSDTSVESAVMMRLERLETLGKTFCRNLASELESGSSESLQILSEMAEENSENLNPLIKKAVEVMEFQNSQNNSSDDLNQQIDFLKSL